MKSFIILFFCLSLAICVENNNDTIIVKETKAEIITKATKVATESTTITTTMEGSSRPAFPAKLISTTTRKSFVKESNSTTKPNHSTTTTNSSTTQKATATKKAPSEITKVKKNLTTTQAKTKEAKEQTVFATTTTEKQPTTTTTQQTKTTKKLPTKTTTSTIAIIKNTTSNSTIRIRQCRCNESESCALSSFKELNECKIECVPKLEYFGKIGHKIHECFEEIDDEIAAFEKCANLDSKKFCTSDNDSDKFIETNTGTVNLLVEDGHDSSDFSDNFIKSTVFVKKAKKAFMHFRSFNKCVTNCYQKKILKCLQASGCGMELPTPEDLNSIRESCSEMKIHENTHKSCQCLQTKQNIRKLVGICPIVRSRVFMRL